LNGWSANVAEMSIEYHPLVERDVSNILTHYDSINAVLGDEFWLELQRALKQAEAAPTHHHFDGKLRRVNLKRFPYHFLFREIPGGVRILVVRHDRMRPTFGTRRA
jgi:plasmid stabilization system protein ParE